jgi:hypothetical protein
MGLMAGSLIPAELPEILLLTHEKQHTYSIADVRSKCWHGERQREACGRPPSRCV